MIWRAGARFSLDTNSAVDANKHPPKHTTVFNDPAAWVTRSCLTPHTQTAFVGCEPALRSGGGPQSGAVLGRASVGLGRLRTAPQSFAAALPRASPRAAACMPRPYAQGSTSSGLTYRDLAPRAACRRRDGRIPRARMRARMRTLLTPTQPPAHSAVTR